MSTKIQENCPRCGANLTRKLGVMFCHNCGAPLRPSQPERILPKAEGQKPGTKRKTSTVVLIAAGVLVLFVCAAVAAIRARNSRQAALADALSDAVAQKASAFQLRLVLDDAPSSSEQMTLIEKSMRGSQSRKEVLYVQRIPLIDQTAVKSATAVTDRDTGASQINIDFTEQGAERLARVTRENIDKRLAIIIDGHIYSAPTIMTEISGGKAQITGITEQEAKTLAKKINDATTPKADAPSAGRR
jgi:preprotein translocase subunit SecD